MTSTPLLDDALTSQAILDDPFAVYAELRDRAPVYWLEPRSTWLISGYEQVRAAFRAPEDFANTGWELKRFLTLPAEVRAQAATLERMLGTPTVVHSDPPLHTRLRGFVNRSFTPRAVAGQREWLRALAAEHYDRMGGREEVDLVHELAHPVPIRAIVELFGGVEADVDLYAEVSKARLIWQGSPLVDPELTVSYNRLLERFRDHLRTLWESADASGRQTLLSQLLARDDADGLTEEELYHACLVFLSAGHETTTALIGAAILALIRNPEQQRRVRDDPSLVPALVEETLRWASPVQRLQRIAHRDFEFFGETLRAGDLISLVLAGANRDPLQFDDPDRFDPARPDAGTHFAFGHGIHFCVGAGLARLEATVALELLLERVESLELDAERPPRWARSVNIRMIESLPVRVAWR